MQTPKPSAASTTLATQRRHPRPAPKIVFPIAPKDDAEIKYILAYSALKADAALRKLEAMRDAEWRRAKWADTPVTLALSAAISELPFAIGRIMASVVSCGELLFCWHGTKATGVAA
jgi:hypothetical protein